MTRKHRRPPGRWPAGRLIAVLTAVVLATSGWMSVLSEGDDSGAVVVAEFANASPLLTGSDIKVHGVKVGTISSITLEDGKALVAMKLDNSALPLHRDATARVRAVSLLGERYLDLDRGTDSAPALMPGARLPISQTSQSTDLDQVLDTIDQPTGDALAELVGALGDGLDGNGQNAAALIKALGPALNDTNGLVRILGQQNGLLNNVVDRLQPVVTALAADNGQSMDSLVDNAATLARTAADRQQNLESTLAGLPQTLTDARQVLGSLTGTAQQTTPTLASLRPATDNLTAISQEITQFTASADPALSAAEPVLDKAKDLLDQARPVTDALRAAGPALRSVAADAQPIVTAVAGNFQNVLNFLRYWALTTNGYDGISHYFRGHVTFDASIAAGHLLGPDVSVPPLNQPPPPVAGAAPQQSAPGGVDGIISNLLGAQGGAPTGLLAPQAAPGDSATGLDQTQESGALQFLLGGGK
ncbi:MCE family protein [Amycolatopsis acidicola]|uniref:MCE family protein n=1 Tax=Amycolatopsis acidicola TaxID=2596893 RepID=A0A5N0VLC2_9PSEU|nr:MlaD family protein [Amycolatopsis acidicola]KAA9165980.1 MCE family protein [Amycolatopsis acidicola]